MVHAHWVPQEGPSPVHVAVSVDRSLVWVSWVPRIWLGLPWTVHVLPAEVAYMTRHQRLLNPTLSSRSYPNPSLNRPSPLLIHLLILLVVEVVPGQKEAQ